MVDIHVCGCLSHNPVLRLQVVVVNHVQVQLQGFGGASMLPGLRALGDNSILPGTQSCRTASSSICRCSVRCTSHCWCVVSVRWHHDNSDLVLQSLAPDSG